MKSLRSNLLANSLIALICLMIHCPKAHGQAADRAVDLLATLPEGSYGSPAPSPADVRYELVDRSYAPTIYAPDALLRIVRRVAEDRYEVRVVSADGKLCMSGSYRDAALHVPHGTFEYYYMNGQVESRGDYELGNRSGVWDRYGADGRRLAERVYLGLTVEQILVALGLSEEACTMELTGDGTPR